jgi:nitrogen fixation NifU-like protein
MTNSHRTKDQEAAEQMEAVYSETSIDRMRNPRNVGLIPNANGQARITGPCGDTMGIWLRIVDGVIEEASFWTDGCGTTIAAGSMVTELAKGKRAVEALRIARQDVQDALGGLPEESVHCALLAANTMKEAVKDYLAYRNEPWKRAYRKC